MALPKAYQNNYIPVKYMLSSYRALIDGRVGISQLRSLLNNPQFLLSEWKIVWLGTCATLRSSIDLFRLDARLCISHELRNEIRAEWDSIKDDKSRHQIFWEFLKKERDNVIHEYHWTAYEAWLDPNGMAQSPPTILGRLLAPSDAKPVLLMRNGIYEGQDSLALLDEAAEWAEERIFSAIRRAGLDPEEKRSASDFHKPPSTDLEIAGLLGRYVAQKSVK